MCDQQVLDIIDEVVVGKTNCREAFTAYDVTKEVQVELGNRGLPIQRHKHIKNDIHRQIEPYVQSGTYERILWDVGAPEKAFLYYPVGYDPANYVGMIKNSNVPQTVVPSQTTPQTYQAKDYVGEPDSRGTLCVPNCLLKDLGVKPADQVFVFVLNNDSVVLSKDDNNNQNASKYTVDKYTNVRITDHVLNQVQIKTSKWRFELDGNTIVVRPV